MPTGLTGVTGRPPTRSRLSWNASPDPNVTGYNVIRRTFLHDPRGSGGTYVYTRIATNVPTNDVTISGTSVAGYYLIAAVNSAGFESVRTPVVSEQTLSVPCLYGAMTTTGAVISSMSLNVGQTGQIYLLSYGNEAPTYSVVSGPSRHFGQRDQRPGDLHADRRRHRHARGDVRRDQQRRHVNEHLYLHRVRRQCDGDREPRTRSATTASRTARPPQPSALTARRRFPAASRSPTTVRRRRRRQPAPTAVVGYVYQRRPGVREPVVTSSLTIDPATPTVTVNGGPFAYDGSAARGDRDGHRRRRRDAGDRARDDAPKRSTTAPTGPGLFTDRHARFPAPIRITPHRRVTSTI